MIVVRSQMLYGIISTMIAIVSIIFVVPSYNNKFVIVIVTRIVNIVRIDFII